MRLTKKQILLDINVSTTQFAALTLEITKFNSELPEEYRINPPELHIPFSLNSKSKVPAYLEIRMYVTSKKYEAYRTRNILWNRVDVFKREKEGGTLDISSVDSVLTTGPISMERAYQLYPGQNIKAVPLEKMLCMQEN